MTQWQTNCWTRHQTCPCSLLQMTRVSPRSTWVEWTHPSLRRTWGQLMQRDHLKMSKCPLFCCMHIALFTGLLCLQFLIAYVKVKGDSLVNLTTWSVAHMSQVFAYCKSGGGAGLITRLVSKFSEWKWSCELHCILWNLWNIFYVKFTAWINFDANISQYLSV